MKLISRAWFILLMTTLFALPPRQSPAPITVTPTTIKSLLNAAKPGDSFVLTDGTYSCITINNRPGVVSNPIVVQAAHIGKAIFTGKGDGFRLQNCPHWEVTGIKATKCNLGIAVLQSDDVKLFHIAADHCTGQGFLSGESSNLQIDGADFGFNIRSNSFAGHGFYVATRCNNAHLKHIYCHDNQANGGQVNGEGGGVIVGFVLDGYKATGNGRAPDGTISGAAMNVLVTDGSKISNVDMEKNYSSGIALYQSTNAMIDTGYISFDPKVGRACISSSVVSDGTFKNMKLVPGHASATVVDGSSKLTDAGGNIIGVGGVK